MGSLASLAIGEEMKETSFIILERGEIEREGIGLVVNTE